MFIGSKKKYLSRFIVCFICSLLQFLMISETQGSASTVITDTDIIAQAYQSSHPLIQEALTGDKAFRAETAKTLGGLLKQVTKMCQEKDPEEIIALTLKDLKQDQVDWKKFTELAKEYKPGIDIPWSLATQKMDLITAGAIPLVQQQGLALLKGEVPKGYSYDPSTPLYIYYPGTTGDPTAIFGNSKSSFLKCALLRLSLRLMPTAKLPDSLSQLDPNASMVHVAPAPEELLKKFPTSAYTFSDGFGFIHNGYAFGGCRNFKKIKGQRYEFSGTRTFAPHDCSTWIADLTRADHLHTTDEFVYAYRSVLEPGTYLDSMSPYQSLTKLYEPVTLKDPQRDITPGQIMVFRRFNLEKDPKMTGTGGYGGHTALVLGVIPSSSNPFVVTYGYNRDMPELEGPVCQAFSLLSEQGKKVMFFNVNKTIT